MQTTHSPDTGSIDFNKIGEYRVEAPLGEGAAATVYRARRVEGSAANDDPNDPAVVALKVLRPEATKQPNVLACFHFEARILSRLQHPGILRVYRTGVDHGRMYTAMELMDGVSFDHYLLANKRLDEAAAVELAAQVAAALGYLHAQDYVHRDIKPANLMLSRAGRLVLFDFGTVIPISDGAPYEQGLYGTPAFLAPEQITPGGRIDGRADLYGLGMILYLMLTGRKPFYGGRNEVLAAHRETPPPSPSDFARISPELEAVVLKSIAKDPDRRFQTGEEFAQALRAAELLPPAENRSLITRLLGRLRARP